MKAILVVGAARSGTTLLGNLLAGSPAVASLAHPLHWGQKESGLGAMMLSYPNLDADTDYVRFVEQLLASDVCAIAGTPRDALYAERLPDAASIYLRVMEDLCRRQGRDAWLGKLDPLLLAYPALLARFRERLRERGHEVHWVTVQRDGLETVNSYLNMEGANSKWKLGWTASRTGIAVHACRVAQIGHFLRDRREEARDGVAAVEYRALVADPAATLAPLLAQIGLPAQTASLADLPRNHSPARSAVPLRKLERALIAGGLRLLARPSARFLADGAVRMREKRRRRYEPFSYRLLLAERYPERLLQRLRDNGETELARRIEQFRAEDALR